MSKSKPCIVCSEPTTAARRGGRCDRCVGVHINGKNARERIVHPMSSYEADPAAQAFVAHVGEATLEQVGEAIGCTRERVRQIEVEALEKVRVEMTERGLTLDDLLTGLEPTDHRIPDSPPPPPKAPAADEQPAPVRRTWSQASSAAVPPSLPEELYSPEGLRLAEGVLELELRAARVRELLARLPPEDPTAIPPLPDRSAKDPHPPEQRTPMSTTITYQGETKSIGEWAMHYAVTDQAIRQRLKKGRNVDGTPTGETASEARPPKAQRVEPETSAVETVEATTEAEVIAALRVKLGVQDDELKDWRAQCAKYRERIATLEADHPASPDDATFGTTAEAVRPNALELLDMAGVEGVRLVSRSARGELIWVPNA